MYLFPLTPTEFSAALLSPLIFRSPALRSLQRRQIRAHKAGQPCSASFSNFFFRCRATHIPPSIQVPSQHLTYFTTDPLKASFLFTWTGRRFLLCPLPLVSARGPAPVIISFLLAAPPPFGGYFYYPPSTGGVWCTVVTPPTSSLLPDPGTASVLPEPAFLCFATLLPWPIWVFSPLYLLFFLRSPPLPLCSWPYPGGTRPRRGGSNSIRSLLLGLSPLSPLCRVCPLLKNVAPPMPPSIFAKKIATIDFFNSV